jgi:hypothetical protein
MRHERHANRCCRKLAMPFRGDDSPDGEIIGDRVPGLGCSCCLLALDGADEAFLLSVLDLALQCRAEAPPVSDRRGLD